jgi:hypothetical protein
MLAEVVDVVGTMGVLQVVEEQVLALLKARTESAQLRTLEAAAAVHLLDTMQVLVVQAM